MGLKYEKKYIEEVTSKSYSIADFCRLMGWVPRGDNYKIFHRYKEEYNLDTSHFTGQSCNICNRNNKHNEKTLPEILTENSYYKTQSLKKKLFLEGYKEYKCEKCGISDWCGNQISLQLHHINGINTDNRIENLQILCPNCHSQTDSFAGNKNKGTKKHYFCLECGQKTFERTKSGFCNKCLINKRGENIPSKNDLIKDYDNLHTFTAVAKKYNVSDTAVHKWFKKYGLK